MSINLLQRGLISIGGILNENFYRTTQATNVAKQELGLDPNQNYLASIAPEPIPEYLSIDKANLIVSEDYVPEGLPADQVLLLDSIYTSNVNQDEFQLSLINSSDTVIYTQRLAQTQMLTHLPKLLIKPSQTLKITPHIGMGSMTINFKLAAQLPEEPPNVTFD